MQGRLAGVVLSLIGAVVGGLVGYWAFFWIARQGLYALVLPGALLGMGCSLPRRDRSTTRGAVCGLAGLALGVFADWGFEKFPADSSFGYFLTHVHKLEPITLIMIVAGGLMAFWLGRDAGYFGRGS